MTFLALLGSAACFLGWPRKYHSTPALVGLLMVALTASAGLAGLVILAAGMPRGVEDSSERLLMHKILVVTEDLALVATAEDEQLARIRLPEASVERIPVEGDLGFINQAVALGEHFAFTGRHGWNGVYSDYLALLGPDGFVIAPGAHMAPEGHELSITLAPEGDEFVLVHTAREPPTATLSTLATDGTLTRREVLPTCDQLLTTAACFSNGVLHLLSSGRAYVVKNGRCERLPGEGVTCPGATRHHRLTQVLAPEGLRPRPPPPGGQLLAQVHTSFTAEGPMLVSEWITPDHRNVVDLGGGRALLVDYLTESETPQHGFIDDAAHFTLLEDGDPVGESFVARWVFAGVKVFRSGETLVVIDQNFGHHARFDATTLKRLDPPGLISSVRARLGVWGGHSAVYEFLLALGLVLAVLIWPSLPFLRGERFSRQRVLVLGCAILVPAVLMTLRRLLML